MLRELAGCPQRADFTVQFRCGGPAGKARVAVALDEPGRVLAVPVKAVSGRDVTDQVVYRSKRQ